jgi:mevalonate kinase
MNLFPAKLLLFGEYSILLGSPALSIPFNRFGASLGFIGHQTGETHLQAEESNHQLRQMCGYFKADAAGFKQFLDVDRLGNDIRDGLFLASTIPPRYGMGSSGALCAAVYDRYAAERNNLPGRHGLQDIVLLRNRFARMESFFHGRSSGFDPLVSYYGTPLYLGREGDAMPVDFTGQQVSESGMEMILVDSGQPCSTGPLVENFLAEFAPGGVAGSAGTTLCNLVNSSAGKLLSGDMDGFRNEITLLSHFQLLRMSHLIPEALHQVWAIGLETGLFTMKLCGSGGGGFLLCFALDKEKAVKYFNDLQIPYLPVC